MIDACDPRPLVATFYELLWNEWDDGAVDGLLAPDFRFRGPLGDETVGRDVWRRYRDAIRTAAPDFHNRIVDLVCEGHAAAVRLECTGHHRGLLLGIEPTGRAFSYPVAAFLNCRSGALVSCWALGDLDGLRRQLTA